MPSQRRRNQVIIWGTQSRVEDERNNSNKTIINYLYYWGGGGGGGGGGLSPSLPTIILAKLLMIICHYQNYSCDKYTVVTGYLLTPLV